MTAIQGEYAPTPTKWVRDQVELYERTHGQEGATLRDTGLPVIIVTMKGRNSGLVRKIALMRVEHEGQYALVGSMGGAPKHPVWYHNLKADPATVTIQDGPEPFPVLVHETEGEERQVWWQRAVAAFPPYAEYQQRTDRLIPVLVADASDLSYGRVVRRGPDWSEEQIRDDELAAGSVDGGLASPWLEPDEIAGLTAATLVERVRALAPFVASRAEAAERERRPDDDVMAALRRAGLYYHFVPKRFGGLELGVADFVEEVLPLAEACASTAWVTSFCMEHNLILALFPEQAQEEIFGSQPYMIAPGAAFPVGQAIAVSGGFRVSGRWAYASGVIHADWAMAMVMVDRPDIVDVRWVIVPIGEVEVHDVWRVDGMAGTGSNDISMNDVFVPEHRTLDVAAAGRGEAPGASLYDNPLYAMPLTTFLALTAALPIVGAARGAQRLFLERLGTRVSTGVKQAERATVQAVLGDVTVAVDVAEMIVRGAAGDVMDLAVTRRAGDVAARAAIRARLTHATTACRDAVRRMLDTAGSSAHDLSNPLQRVARDIAMASAHVVHDPLTTAELYGRTLLGLPPQTPIV